MSNRTKLKPISRDDIAWTYCGAAFSVVWYVLKGSDDNIYLFWALAFFVYATGQKIIREIRLKVASPKVEAIADRILEAGYRKPQKLAAVEELKALEDPEAVLTDYKHNAYQWGIGLDGSEGWQSTRDPNPITSDHLWRFAPLTVLHVGGAE